MSLEPAISVTPSEIDKVNLLGLSASSLGDLFEQMGEKRFRGTQVLKWIHQMGVCDLDQMTNISKPLRARLAELGEVRIPEVELPRLGRRNPQMADSHGWRQLYRDGIYPRARARHAVCVVADWLCTGLCLLRDRQTGI